MFALSQFADYPVPVMVTPRVAVCINHAPATGRCMNHAPGILAALALIYSTHRLLVVWIIVVHFHLCSLLDRYTALEV